MTLKISMLVPFLFLSIFPGHCIAKKDVVKMSDPLKTHILFKKALNDRNIDQLQALYSDDCVMVLGNGKESKGSDAARKIFETWVKGVVKFDIETVFSIRSGNVVLFRSKYHSVYKDDKGVKYEYSSSGIEVVQQQKDGTWQIILDHHRGGDNLPMALYEKTQ
jgi:uncharacterized protein (TIGR02246 family)